MNKIDAQSRTIREILSGVKYSVDYYQREYKWETKNISELLEDLETQFMDNYEETHERWQVQQYSPYFLGSIVINQERGENYIIDGQQRLTSLTLLFIFLHRFQQQQANGYVDVSALVLSEKYGQKTYNLNVEDRIPAIDALYHGKHFDLSGKSESTQNIIARYEDIEELFPESLRGRALPFFIDWLLDNVNLVEITAYSDEAAYTIFETMNDRGLSLSPTDMLKGYLLANIVGDDWKEQANIVWKRQLLKLAEIGGEKEEEADFFKAWLRGKYAESIRERRKGASNRDFERIGTTFHKWVREERTRIGLESSLDFREFVLTNYERFSNYYIRLREASLAFHREQQYVYYNANNNFTLQYPLILAALCVDDDLETASKKMRLVSGYIDIFVARRVWNFRTLGYSAIVYTMFNIMRDLRNRSVPELVDILASRVEAMDETFDTEDRFRVHQQNRHYVHHMLARITYHIEDKSGIPTDFVKYVSRDLKKPYELEHIWADKYERHAGEFQDMQEFADHRNRFGDLLLLPRGFNQSLGADTYEVKVRSYYGQNLLAQSLNEQCYLKNPGFRNYMVESGLPFKPYEEFNRRTINERHELYREICKEIWSPDRFQRELVS